MRAVVWVALVVVAPFGAEQSRAARPFVPVGVVDDRPGPFGREGFEELRKLRFNVVMRRDLLDSSVGGRRVIPLLPAKAHDAGALPPPITIGGLSVVRVSHRASGALVRREAWVEIGRGFRGVIFDGWMTLRENPDALEAAASFADGVTRNAALFGPLTTSTRVVRVDAASDAVFATFVESPEAIVLVAANLTASDRRVTLTFTPDTPEAIWQNMESGAAVNFVAGLDGPSYTRTFSPHDVVVLMIRKQYR